MDPVIEQSLKNISLFAGLSAQTLAELAQKLEEKQLRAGEVLFDKGDAGDSLYVIQSGSVKAFAYNQRGEEVMLNQFGPGESFGEMALIDGQPRSASIGAINEAVLLKLHQDDFLAVLRQNPTFALEMLRDISAKLRFAANYIQKVTEWSEIIAQGDYSAVINEIKTTESSVEETEEPTEKARAQAFLNAISQMIDRVKAREERLRRQVQRLRIKIDERKRASEVAEITETEYFQTLQRRARELRKKTRGSD